MSAGRRGFFLSAGFLALSLALCAGSRASAQPGRFAPPPRDPGTGKHTIWKQSLTPDQVRDALTKFGQAGNPDDALIDLLRQVIGAKNPDATPEQVDAAAKKLMADKVFRDRVIDAIQKHKNENPNFNGNARPGNNGPPPKFTREDLAKLVKVKPDAGQGGDPFRLPDDAKGGPDQLPPFNPKSKDFDPKKFPFVDPDNPPQFDPKTGFPVDPDSGKPFDPRTGKAIDPKDPPKIAPPPPRPGPDNPPVAPKDGPPPVPQPKAEQPPPPQPDTPKFDPENPLGPPKDAPDTVAKAKAVETATAIWEKNVGPIEESPGVKQAIIDLVSDPDAMDALKDAKGESIFDAIQKDDGSGEKISDWFGGGDSNWEWPKFDFNWGRGDRDLDFGGRNRNRDRDRSRDRDPSYSRGSSNFDGSFNLGGMQVPLLVLLALLAIVVAAVVWWRWGSALKPGQRALALGEEGGGWPVDPRLINSREDVVKVFEYLSVLLCGRGAKTWTHSTIAGELSRLAESEPDTALKLARLYELARYAPLDEPLTRAELLEARRLACDLAGLDEA